MTKTEDFKVGQRVRFVSDIEDEPIGTIIEVEYKAVVKIGWDDGHAPSIVHSDRLHTIEKV